MQTDSFCLNTENFSEMHRRLGSQLSQLKIEYQNILRTKLLVEEIFLRMIKNGQAAQVDVKIKKNFFGKVQVKMTTEGFAYNPLVEVSDWQDNDEDENYFSMMILSAHRENLNWQHRQNLNVVTIIVQSKSTGENFLTITCIVGGIVCGAVMKEIFLPETILFVKEDFIAPTQTMFLNALNLLIAPVIFFSIVSGVTGISASTGTSKIGLKLICCSLGLIMISVCCSYAVAWIFFGSGVPQIIGLPAAQISAETKTFSLIQFIVDIIPDDFVSPVAEGKILQIIFVAVFFGTALSSLGDKVTHLKELLDDLNNIFIKMLSLLMFFMPPIVFLAMMNFAFDTAAETVKLISQLLVGEIIVAALMFGCFLIFIRQFGKISPRPFLKKVPKLLPPAFATSSSSALMPSMMELCTNKLGVAPKISSFTVPLSVTFNTAGSLICIIMASVMFLRMYGVEVGLYDLVMISFLAMMFSFGAPDFISVITIINHFGLPMEIATLLFCIEALSDRIGTCVNVLSNMTATLTLARTENLLDDKIYFSS